MPRITLWIALPFVLLAGFALPFILALLYAGFALGAERASPPVVSAIPRPSPATLMAEAWAGPFFDLGDAGGPWLADPSGLCRNKVLWVMRECACGRPLIGWRAIPPTGRVLLHMALEVGGTVYDFDGATPREDYPMRLDPRDWSSRYETR